LLGYLALPVDLVPDFVPVLGYTDDAIVVVLALRSVVRRVGVEPLRALAGHRGRLHHALPACPPP